MATFAERFTQALIIRQISAAELSRRLNINEATLSQYKKGMYEPKQRRTELIAKALNVSIPWLMGADVPMEEEPSPSDTLTVLPGGKVFMRPLFDSVAAGFGAPADNTILSYIPTYINNGSEQDLYIWVNVQGDSMSPLIDDGSKILVKKQDSVDSGQIAVALIDGEDAVVKKVAYGSDWIELLSVNPYYPPRRFEGAEVQRIRILGIVKEVSKTLQ